MNKEKPKLSAQSSTTKSRHGLALAPDPVIEAYKKDVDRTLLLENLKLTAAARFQKFEAFMQGVMDLRRAGAQFRQGKKDGS